MYATHPTKNTLIQTVVDMLDAMDVADLQVDQVLERSGVSKGSLYHHFEDFSHLIEAAHVFRFGGMIDRSITSLTAVLVGAPSKAAMVEGLKQVTRNTQAPELAALRFERARALALAEHQPRMRTAMAAEQARLTSSIADIAREAQSKGWIREDVDPMVLAVFIQAYSLGKIVDDISAEPIDQQRWVGFIDDIVEKVLLAD